MKKGAPIVCLQDFEEAARRKLTATAYDFVAGGAADEITIRWNREAYERIRLRPRVLVDVSQVDVRVKLFGLDLPHPILLAPAAYQKLLHKDGEIATARGAAKAGALFVVSSNATVSIEDIAKAAPGPFWLQLYTQADQGRNRDLIERAQAAGCKALVVTVDTPVIGPRHREQRAGFALPKNLTLPMNPQNMKERRAGSTKRVSLTWKEIEEFQALCKVPVLLKGILHPDDADRAVGLGVGGVVVSNHGGRNLDTAPATIEALPAIVDRVAGRVPVLVDGGIRRGTDVLKALAEGAAAVLIGRPYLCALAVGGADGVANAVGLLRSELETAMALCGRARIADVDRSLIG
ncbi:MAG TPA: alpha-hydroxy acid oxidase [Planctomycetota bacterium]|nr:alpha-hydroxy acid oxidase [Planctomycetota bacterium]